MENGDRARRLEELVEAGWKYHDTDTERLARELEAAADHGASPAALAPILHLSNHAIGEHLGDWTRAFDVGTRILCGRTPSPETAKAWGRLYVAGVLAGDGIAAVEYELAYLRAAGDDFGAALLDMRFMLACALVASKRTGEAGGLYRGALELVDQIRPSALLDRTIAIASNNLGWELYETPARTAQGDALMRYCAQMGLSYWLKCGDWINEARALYFKALVSNVTGSPQSGLADADRALAVIRSHGERPLDTAFLHLARATSLAALGNRNDWASAMAAADAAAAKLAAPELMARFAAERAKTLAPFR